MTDLKVPTGRLAHQSGATLTVSYGHAEVRHLTANARGVVAAGAGPAAQLRVCLAGSRAAHGAATRVEALA